MSLGLLFPGQGTQHPQMLPWLEDPGPHAPVLKHMSARLGADWRQRLSDPTWAFQNSVAQVLLTGVGLAAWSAIRDQLPSPRVAAGYSVGELAAFGAAGVFPVEHALALAAERATLMDEAMKNQQTGLIAIHGLSEHQIDALCTRHGVFLAIDLHASACVIGGALSALSSAGSDARRLGATSTPLNVPLASHTPWLAPAVAALRAELEQHPFAPPAFALACNIHGHTEHRPDGLRTALAGQIAQPVQWRTCMASLQEQGITCVLEAGPGTTLSALWNAQYPDIPARSLDEFQHPSGAVAWVRRHLNP
ncbi:acyltransferase domain-containing protein [Hydrogenophaga sp. PAMC20947]|uniref:ACP S-malonyltransferase n=1 Tax=Hydrogenophaga sp. PAMC20947 TaxID=2565558 RepID=UPI00109E2A38|nr:acyltransferase domain-containing protein [Hydrogenophaga sp. PAMC20947]QCB46872.1 acyltransferase domain-containing protein [Hydrogenophaga sp. PAMC20947]